MKVYLRTKSAEKILQNKKLNKISRNLISSVQRNIHRIKTLKHNAMNIQNPQNRKLAMKQLKKEVIKTNAMLKVVGKINHHVKKNILQQRKYQNNIRKYNGQVPARHQPIHKVSPHIAKKAVGVLAERISGKLERAGCRIPHVQKMLKNIRKVTKLMDVNGATHNTHRSSTIPRRVHGGNTHDIAKRMKRAINVRKHISHAKINRASHVIAKKILKNSSNKHVATALAKKFALRVLKDPKATNLPKN
jgi:hypothetical protein